MKVSTHIQNTYEFGRYINKNNRDRIFCPGYVDTFEFKVGKYTTDISISSTGYTFSEEYKYRIWQIRFKPNDKNVKQFKFLDDTYSVDTIDMIHVNHKQYKPPYKHFDIKVRCTGIFEISLMRTSRDDIVFYKEINNFLRVPYINFYKKRIRRICGYKLIYDEDWKDVDEEWHRKHLSDSPKLSNVRCYRNKNLPMFYEMIYGFDIESKVYTELVITRYNLENYCEKIKIYPGRRIYYLFIPRQMPYGCLIFKFSDEKIIFPQEDQDTPLSRAYSTDGNISYSVLTLDDKFLRHTLWSNSSGVFIHTNSKVMSWCTGLCYEELNRKWWFDPETLPEYINEKEYIDKVWKLPYFYTETIVPPRIDMMVYCMMYRGIPNDLIYNMFEVYMNF